MINPTRLWNRFQALLPKKPIQYGVVDYSTTNGVVATMEGGGQLFAYSTSSIAVGMRVKVEGNTVVGTTPHLAGFSPQDV